jgi:hypothetical protein
MLRRVMRHALLTIKLMKQCGIGFSQVLIQGSQHLFIFTAQFACYSFALSITLSPPIIVLASIV